MLATGQQTRLHIDRVTGHSVTNVENVIIDRRECCRDLAGMSYHNSLGLTHYLLRLRNEVTTSGEALQ